MEKYTIEKIKKEEIWVKCSGENAKRFLKAIGSNYYSSNFSNRFYRYDSSEGTKYGWSYATPSFFIEFPQVIFEGEPEVVSEIDHYECISPILGHFLGTKSTNPDCAKLPEYFKPIYKINYKIGDAITITEVIPSWTNTDSWITKTKQRTFWIIGGESMYVGGLCFMLSDAPDGKQIGGYPKSSFRHATNDEIEFANKVKIGEYEVLINTTTGMASINGVGYSGNHLQYLLEVMEKGQIKSLNCGCNGQYKVDLETIRRITKKLN